jgi:histidinol-phosphate phosphatase family protein
MKRAIFLDRDGVLNRAIIKEGKPFSPRKPREFELIDGVKDLLISLRDAGFVLIVVTNQPDISRGLLSREELQSFHDLIRKEFPVDDIIVCPHDDADNCDCRKPKPGMIVDSARKWGIDIESSFIIEGNAVVNESVSMTLSRTTLTSLTTFFVVLTLYLFGGEIISGFSFTLLVGIIVGTYSSIFVAASFLVQLKFSIVDYRSAQAVKERRKKDKDRLRAQFEQGTV